MTSKLYLSSDSLSAVTTVLSCTPAEEGQFHLRLAETLFHPQGGGQPSDRGEIGPARVVGVFLDNEEVVHVTDRPLAVGEWLMAVDEAHRQLTTRLHSAGHLIAAVGEARGWTAIKGNHRPGEGRVVFESPVAGHAAPEADSLRAAVNALVRQALPRRQDISGGVRRITWGDLPLYSCGGTHVASTDRVGEVVINSVKFRKGQLSVSYSLAEQGLLTVEQAS
ncbi:alanyl-tRNA editing protein [Erwinia sp. SLM-02]|uniref:alanyl-tRNA editing protein n=1 Tax=Erwinia sp. SLM-02 TaxID=3020057 RepID=UPI00308000C6